MNKTAENPALMDLTFVCVGSGESGKSTKQSKREHEGNECIQYIKQVKCHRNRKARKPQRPSLHFTIPEGGEGESPEKVWREAFQA